MVVYERIQLQNQKEEDMAVVLYIGPEEQLSR